MCCYCLQTCLFAAERIRAVTEEYIQRVTTDDPETQRLAAMRRGQCGQDWTQLLRLRSRFANLSWEQRQLIHETMDPPARDKQETLRLAGEPRLAAVNEDEFTAERLLRDNPLDASLFQYLVTEAEAGDAEAQFALARWFVPPRFARSAHCCVCHRSFGVSLFRHSCRNCGRSLCTDHSLQRRRVLHYGINVPVRVCDACARVIDREVAVDQLEWRKSRVQAFLRGQLLLYRRPVVDRGIDKAYR